MFSAARYIIIIACAIFVEQLKYKIIFCNKEQV